MIAVPDTLAAALVEMSRAVHALNLELPESVAIDVTKRWRNVLVEIDRLTADEVDEVQP